MAWTDLPAYTAGSKITAAMLELLRGNFKAIGDPWTSYTTTWTASSVNPSIGNGSLNGFYAQTGKWVRFRIFLDYGSTTNAGTGDWFFTLPVASIAVRGALGNAVCYNGSLLYPRLAYSVNATTMVVSDFTPTRITGTVPFTWNSNSELNIIGQYEVA